MIEHVTPMSATAGSAGGPEVPAPLAATLSGLLSLDSSPRRAQRCCSRNLQHSDTDARSRVGANAAQALRACGHLRANSPEAGSDADGGADAGSNVDRGVPRPGAVDAAADPVLEARRWPGGRAFPDEAGPGALANSPRVVPGSFRSGRAARRRGRRRPCGRGDLCDGSCAGAPDRREATPPTRRRTRTADSSRRAGRCRVAHRSSAAPAPHRWHTPARTARAPPGRHPRGSARRPASTSGASAAARASVCAWASENERP